MISTMLITENYKRLQSQLHADNPAYGSASVFFAPAVAMAIEQENAIEILDYGAGKGRLIPELNRLLPNRRLKFFLYDPAIPAWCDPVEPREFVACIDVLEHIEPECLDAVLDDLQRLTARAGFFTVHTGPAVKILADGRNAHLIQKPAEWWILEKLAPRFVCDMPYKIDNGFTVKVWRK